MTTDNRTNEPSHNRIKIRAFRDGEVSIIHEDQVLGLACTLDELKRAVATYEARGALEAADRPAGTFTEAQVEVAAKALASREPMRSATAWENLHEFERKHYRDDSRAALVAAGVASQPACLNCDEPVAESDLKANYVGRGYVHQVKCPQVPSEWGHGVIGGDDLLHRIMDTLAYYHCRSVNPKADHPRMGYHAMTEEQREHLREKQREAAEEIVRMLPSLSNAIGCKQERYIEELESVDGVGLRAERDAALAAIERVTRAKLEVDSVHQFHGNDCLCGFSSARSRSRTEHITGALLAALDGAPEPEVKP